MITDDKEIEAFRHHSPKMIEGYKLALIHISEKLNSLDARIVHTQHDEIIVEVRDDIADQVRQIVKECMEKALTHIFPEVPFAVEIRVAEARG